MKDAAARRAVTAYRCRTTTPPTTATSPNDPVSVAVLATYRAYWNARVQALAEPAKSLPDGLARYASGAAENDMKAAVLLFRQQGIQFRGQPLLSPEITDVAARTASIRDCVDSTDWKPVYAATGKSALAPGQPLRVVMTSSLTKDNDVWRVVQATVERDRTC